MSDTELNLLSLLNRAERLLNYVLKIENKSKPQEERSDKCSFPLKQASSLGLPH